MVRITSDNTQLSESILGPVTTPITNANDCKRRPQQASDYISASLAGNTRRAYRSDVARFLEWGGCFPATPQVVARFLADQAPTTSPHTLSRRLVSIAKLHAVYGFSNPCNSELVRSTLRGIRRVHSVAQRQVDPLLREDLLAALDALPNNTKGVRDRALLLVGFAAALRRSELVSLQVEDLTFAREGVVICLRRSKVDQEQAGRDIGVPFGRSLACPVKAIRAWLDHAGITAGAIFRSIAKDGRISEVALSNHAVASVVKEAVARIGLDATCYSGHSLRAGLITSAAKLGVSTWKIRQQSGHRSEGMVYRYIRDGELFINNAAGAVL